MIEVALKQHRSRDPIDALPPLLPFDAARDERAVCRRRRQAFVDKLHRKARFSPDRISKPSRRGCFRSVRSIEAQWQSDDDPGRLVAARDIGQPPGKALDRLCRHCLDTLGDGRGRVAQGEADALRPWIDRENPQQA